MSPENRPVPLLAVEDLSVEFRTRSGTVRALDGIDFALRRGETLGLVGESGSGKSVTSLTVMGLLQKNALAPTGGSAKLVGEELLTAMKSADD